mgnify:CR=1 FL=1
MVSFSGPLLELAYICWVPAQIHVVGFFSNLILVACFVGIGLGPSQANRPDKEEESGVFRFALLNMI